MTRLTWGSPGKRKFETGVDRVVFYPQQGPGVPWDGVTAIKEDPTGSDIPLKYIDGVPYNSKKTKEGFALMLQAYSCPQEFEEYEGTPGILTRQTGKAFGLSYRTLVGNDKKGLEHAYKIHLVYNALAMPSSVDYNSIPSDGLDATPFSWGISTKPIPIPGAKPAAHLIIDTQIAYPAAIQAVEDVIYGNLSDEPRLPTPAELIDLFEQHAILLIVDHGDGTWSAIGPDSAIQMLDSKTFQISWPSAVYLDEDTYQISSL
jgi:hypothetical protein